MKPPFPYGMRRLFFVFLCTVCFRTVPFPLVVLSVFKTTVDVASWIHSVAPWYPSRTIRSGRDRHRDDVGEGMADGEKGARGQGGEEARRGGEKEARRIYRKSYSPCRVAEGIGVSLS